MVGPCAAGKSTLVEGLRRHGLQARQIAQEHSYVADMWQRLSRPETLVFLDASYQTCTRRKQLRWLVREYDEQQRRLAHARDHCDILLATDELTPGEVLQRVLSELEAAGRIPGAPRQSGLEH